MSWQTYQAIGNIQWVSTYLLTSRDWRVREINLHKTDENYSRVRLQRGGQEDVHKTSLPEHLHGHAIHDQSHGPPQNPIWGWIMHSEYLRSHLIENMCHYLIFRRKLSLFGALTTRRWRSLRAHTWRRSRTCGPTQGSRSVTTAGGSISWQTPPSSKYHRFSDNQNVYQPANDIFFHYV